MRYGTGSLRIQRITRTDGDRRKFDVVHRIGGGLDRRHHRIVRPGANYIKLFTCVIFNSR
jgi:hypothetical protein